MKKIIALVFAIVCIFTLFACTREPEEQKTVNEDGFTNAVPAKVNDNIIQNCTSYSENLGYKTGEMKKAVLLGTDWLSHVYCEDDMKQELIDSRDIVVIFENIRCVVDTETEIVLGRIPFV